MELGRFANVSMTGTEILVLIQAMTVKISFRSCVRLLSSIGAKDPRPAHLDKTQGHFQVQVRHQQ